MTSPADKPASTGEINASNTDPHDTHTTVTVHDVVWTKYLGSGGSGRNVVSMATLLVIPLILVLGVIKALLALQPVQILPIAAPVAFGCALITIASTRAGMEELRDMVRHRGPAEAMMDAVSSARDFTPHAAVKRTLRAIATTGHGGIAFRFLPEDDLDPPAPITMPFEPVVPDESDPMVLALRAEAGDPRTAGPPASSLTTNIKRIGGWPAVITVGVVVSLVLMEMLRGRQSAGWAMFYLIAASFMVARWYGDRSRFMVVPGGLTTRKARGWRRAPAVHLFTPTTSAVCINRLSKNRWVVTVADSQDADGIGRAHV